MCQIMCQYWLRAWRHTITQCVALFPKNVFFVRSSKMLRISLTHEKIDHIQKGTISEFPHNVGFRVRLEFPTMQDLRLGSNSPLCRISDQNSPQCRISFQVNALFLGQTKENLLYRYLLALPEELSDYDTFKKKIVSSLKQNFILMWLSKLST